MNYIKNYQEKNETAESNFQYYKEYYNSIFKYFENQLPEHHLIVVYSVLMKQQYEGEDMLGIVPHVTLNDFIKRLKEEE